MWPIRWPVLEEPTVLVAAEVDKVKTFTPYPHQRAGINWIIERPACALLWGMGTGKTVTTLTAIQLLLYDLLEDGPALVVAPKRVAEDTWSKEAAKWDHLQHLRVVKIMGTAKQRKEALRRVYEGPFADVYVINRENVPWLMTYTSAMGPSCTATDPATAPRLRSMTNWPTCA